MVLDIIEHIGKKLQEENPYIDAFANNCIKTKDGYIVNFVGEEKNDFSPTDIIGIGAYTRIDPNISYNEETVTRRESCAPKVRASKKFRLVLFQCGQNKKVSAYKLEDKIRKDLVAIGYGDYVGGENEIKLAVNSSSLNFYDNFVQEVGKKYNVGADSIIVAWNCTLSYVPDNCRTECDVYEDSEKC